MANTPSHMVSLGTAMPAFSLPDTISGRTLPSSALAGKPSVVIFICNHCPFVKHIRAGLAEFGKYCRSKGVPMVAISSNDIADYPDDAPLAMAREAASEQTAERGHAHEGHGVKRHDSAPFVIICQYLKHRIA